MERRRNRPEKYDRQLLHKTVKAMQKVDEVRNAAPRGITPMAIAHFPVLAMACSASAYWFLMSHVLHPKQHVSCHSLLLTCCCAVQMRVKRQERLHNERMARAKGVRVAAEQRELEQDITLIRAPVALARDVEAYQKQQKQQEKIRIPVEQSQQPQPELMDE